MREHRKWEFRWNRH